MYNPMLQNGLLERVSVGRKAFGMGIKNREYVAFKNFRYKFNGKETDSETGTQDYGMRIYDTRLGKFLSIDPLTKEYPWYSPYHFAGNTPIMATDLDGAETNIAIDGSVINGPMDMQVINANLLKGNPSLSSNNNLIMVNTKIIAYKTGQQFYELPKEIPAEKPLFEFKVAVWGGLKAKVGAKVAGIGVKVEAGKSQNLISGTLTEEGDKVEVLGETTVDYSIGVGPVTGSVSKNVSQDGEYEGSFSIGPKRFSPPTEESDPMLSVVDLSVGAGLGVELSLKVNENLIWGGPTGSPVDYHAPMIANDATYVATPPPVSTEPIEHK